MAALEAGVIPSGPMLLHAALDGEPELCSMLINAGIDVNTEIKTKLRGTVTPLQRLLQDRITPKRAAEVCEVLFNRGARADAQLLANALDYAAADGNAALCRVLLAAGARHGDTLYTAIRGEQTDVCKVLIEQGVVVAPYHLAKAAARGYSEICKILMDAGANASEVDACRVDMSIFTEIVTHKKFDAESASGRQCLTRLVELAFNDKEVSKEVQKAVFALMSGSNLKQGNDLEQPNKRQTRSQTNKRPRVE